MRCLYLGLGLAILTGCASTPRTVERVSTVICPAAPPALVCAGWRPDYRPVGVAEIQALYLERGGGLHCRDTLIDLWEQTWQDCQGSSGE